MQLNETQKLDITGENLKIAFLVPHFNRELSLELFENTKSYLQEYAVKSENISQFDIGGALEAPLAAKRIIEKHQPDAIIVVGAVIRGDTTHYDLVTEISYQGLMDVQLSHDTPIIYGILTCENEQQAKDRASREGLDKGKQLAQATILQCNI